MTSKERILNILRNTADWNAHMVPRDMAAESNAGGASFLTVYPFVSPDGEVAVKRLIDVKGGQRILTQKWVTPARTVQEQLYLTDDWDRSERRGSYISLQSDFRPDRYIEFLFKDERDLAVLEYLFPFDSPTDDEMIAEEYASQRALADQLDVPLFLFMDAGLDWLSWLYPAGVRSSVAVGKPEMVKRLTDHINHAKFLRMERILALGVDGVIRRGLHESGNYWNTEQLRTLACPALEKEIGAAKAADIPYIYALGHGAVPILSGLEPFPVEGTKGFDLYII